MKKIIAIAAAAMLGLSDAAENKPILNIPTKTFLEDTGFNNNAINQLGWSDCSKKDVCSSNNDCELYERCEEDEEGEYHCYDEECFDD